MQFRPLRVSRLPLSGQACEGVIHCHPYSWRKTFRTPQSCGKSSPIQGENGSRPEDGSYEDDPGGGNLLGAEAAERNHDPLVAALVRLAQRAKLLAPQRGSARRVSRAEPRVQDAATEKYRELVRTNERLDVKGGRPFHTEERESVGSGNDLEPLVG